MKKFIILLALCAFSATAGYTLPKETNEQPEQIKTELMQLEHDIAKANVAHDTKFLESTLGDEIIFTAPGGQVLTKKDMVAALHQPLNPNFKMESIDIQDMNVLPYGNLGVVTGGLLIKAKTPQGDTAMHFRFTSVFKKWEGHWLFVAGQTSMVSQ